MCICVSLMVVSSKMLLRCLVLNSDPKMCARYFAPRLYYNTDIKQLDPPGVL